MVWLCRSQNTLGLSELDYLNVSYTTTDIDAALSVTGTVLQSVRKERTSFVWRRGHEPHFG
jgi:hypothetical protein